MGHLVQKAQKSRASCMCTCWLVIAPVTKLFLPLPPHLKALYHVMFQNRDVECWLQNLSQRSWDRGLCVAFELRRTTICEFDDVFNMIAKSFGNKHIHFLLISHLVHYLSSQTIIKLYHTVPTNITAGKRTTWGMNQWTLCVSFLRNTIKKFSEKSRWTAVI